MSATRRDGSLSQDAIPKSYHLPRIRFAETRSTLNTPEEKASHRISLHFCPQNEHERSPDAWGSSTHSSGSELAPDYMVWKNYVEQSKEHDKDLVDRRNKNLDTMLLFAGLFSAILTAFLIESTDMMEEDLAETSAKLLLLLAQSQWRIETGNQVDSLPPVELPDFSPTTEARWINGLWFMALALALGAAMLAMLAKEWLAEFIASAPTHPLENARERQSRLETLINWHTLRIIDFLPTLLHSSLVLFILGLIVRLWLLDRIIAYFIAAVSATLPVCYIIMVILGAVHEKSPYRARVSIHLAKFFAILRGLLAFNCVRSRKRQTKQKAEAKKAQLDEVATEDLRALIWLIAQATDRNIIGGAFGVLASLVTRLLELRAQKEINQQSSGALYVIMYPLEHTSTLFRRFIDSSQDNPRKSIQETHSSTLSVLDDHQTIIGVGLELADHIAKMPTDYNRELTFCKGANVVRYVNALVEVYCYAWEPLTKVRNQSKEKRHEKQDLDEQEMIEKLEESTFIALDAIWDSDHPPFSADAYTELTVAELTLARLAACKNLAQVDHTSYSQGQDPSRSHRTISVHELGTISDPKSVPSLRARYSRGLCRATFLLAAHQDGRMTIGKTALIDLLGAINNGATTDSLDSSGYMITHHPQSDNDDSTAITILRPDEDDYYTLRSKDIGHKHGLLAVLTSVLGGDSVKAAFEVETAAIRAMESVTPKLIKQWMAIQENTLTEQFESDSKEHDDIPTFVECASNWATFEYHKPSSFGPRPYTYAETAISHLLQVAHFAVSFLGVDGICQLPEIVLKVLCDRISTGPTTEARKEEYDYIIGRTHLLQIWIKSLGRTGAQPRDANRWSEEAKMQLLRLLAIQDGDETIFSQVLQCAESTEEGHSLARELFLIVLDNMVDVKCHPAVLESLFKTVSSRARKSRVCSQVFTDDSEGFECLQRAGPESDHAGFVSNTIAELIVSLTQQSSSWIKSRTTPGFLDALSFLIACRAHQWERRLDDYFGSIDQAIKGLLVDASRLSDDVLLALSERVRDLMKLVASAGPSNQATQAYFENSKAMILNEQNRRREPQSVAGGSSQVVGGSSHDQILEAEDGGTVEGFKIGMELPMY